MKRLIFIVLLGCGNASASEWVHAGKRSGTDFYIDPLSVKESGKYRSASIMTDLESPKQIFGGRQATYYLSTRRVQYFDCTKKTSAVTESSFHAESMGEGEMVERYSTNLRSASFSKPHPDTLDDKVLEVVCSTPL